MSVQKRVLSVVRHPEYVPLTSKDLYEELQLGGAVAKQEFKHLIRTMQEQGLINKIKGERIVAPVDADLIQGVIRFKQSGNAVFVPHDPVSDHVPESIPVNANDTNVSLHEDEVLIRLKRPSPKRRYSNKKKRNRGNDDILLGKVVEILSRKRDTFTGTLQKARTYFYVIPDDPKIVHDIIVPDPATTKLKSEINDKVVVKLIDWQHSHLLPEGQIVENLGPTHSPMAEYQAVLHKYNLNPEFPKPVRDEVIATPSKVAESSVGNRMDCRDLFTITIDPDDAKDFDDAVSLEKLPEGQVRVGIHIADVSFYCKPDTQLDKEAKRRGNSTYLVGSVIPMLPFELSNGICSLVEAEDRMTKSVFLTFNSKLKLVEERIANTVIRSNKRLTYGQAFSFLAKDDLDAIKDTPLPPKHQTGSTGRELSSLSHEELVKIQKQVRTLWKIAEKLRKQRMRQGSLDLDIPEVKIYVDKHGSADKILPVSHDESHQLIEEFMLAANETVARLLFEAKFPFVSRVHDQPDDEKLEELRETLLTYDVRVGDLTNKREISKFLRIIKDHPQGYTLKIHFLRSLKQACYRASADGHYGLHKRFYAHFTSPIRRYADLVIHRMIDAYLIKRNLATASEELDKFYSKADLDKVSEHISITERNSVEAERESHKIKLLEFFEKESGRKKPRYFEAIITDIKSHGMFVELYNTSAFGFIPIATVRDDNYRLNKEMTAFVGRKKGRRFAVGQEILVCVHEVDRFKRQIDFVVADPG